MDDDYDTPWKEAVAGHFPEFMAFYFPGAHAAIDWSRPHDFLDQELAALSHDAALGKRFGPLDVVVAERVAQADLQQLSAWALSFVDAQSLGEVFGD